MRINLGAVCVIKYAESYWRKIKSSESMSEQSNRLVTSIRCVYSDIFMKANIITVVILKKENKPGVVDGEKEILYLIFLS